MRLLIAISISFILTDTFGQVTVDTSMRHRYDSAYRTLPIQLRQNLERTEKELQRLNKEIYKETNEVNNNVAPTIAVVTLYQIDTLNKEQVKLDTYKKQFEKWQFLFCEGGLKSDTLGVILYPGVAQNSGVILSSPVVGKQIYAELDEWRKWDTTFRKNLSDERTDNLVLPLTTTRFVLSDTNFTIGKTIYGFTELISDGYYKDDENFKTGYINKRLSLAYYFKFRVKKNSN